MWRRRGRHVEKTSRAVQHMHTALTQMNLQLAKMLIDISGRSWQANLATKKGITWAYTEWLIPWWGSFSFGLV